MLDSDLKSKINQLYDNELAKGWGQTVTPLEIKNKLVTICNQLKLPSSKGNYVIIETEKQRSSIKVNLTC